MNTRLRHRTARPARAIWAVAGLGTMSLTAVLTGCATGADAATDGAASATASPDATADDATTGTYTDGDYSADGEYQTPGGQESIEVELTLADGVVTAVTVTGEASGGNAERYQTEFENGIADEVVGQSIDELSVDTVAGSSLTSDGFNAAVEQIKSEATA